jgi:hypothetical protein
MNMLKFFFNYLNEKPIIGMAGGFSSGIILTVQGFLTDETILNVVAAVGVWMGAMMAFFTLMVKAFTLFRDMYYFFKLKRK